MLTLLREQVTLKVVLLSALFTGEPLTGTLLLSSLLVAAGIGLTSRPQD